MAAEATPKTTEALLPDLSVEFCGSRVKNPVIAASETFGYGIEFEDIVHLDKVGGFVTKGLSREPMAGHPPPRIFETAAGMLNSIGLQNIGVRAFLDDKLPKLRRKKDIIVIANVFGYAREDYQHVTRALNEGEGIAAYEINVSCPNTKHGGMIFGCDPVMLTDVVEFMLAGAAAVEVGTANYFDPVATEKIVDDLSRWCIAHRVGRITDLIGALDA